MEINHPASLGYPIYGTPIWNFIPREPGIQQALADICNEHRISAATKRRFRKDTYFKGVIFYKQIDRSPIFGVYFEQP